MGVLLTRNALFTFDELLAKVVDEVLKSIFTERCAFSVWTYLEMTFSIEPLDVARKPETFSAGFKSLFGPAAQDLEKLILTRLCQILGVKLEWKEGYKFSDYISTLRKAYVEIETLRYKPLIEG
ncbi:MAG: hypothetical protein QHH12_04775 [Candidatus Bathyarchaeota archaeon]|nr:hypothetical protein [Candidatus Bathyarchaeota archaeon A05DMB-3]MDH7607066.1 hypothetical protein [Candidatus Bathyarchaeota archaeon]